MYKCDQCGRVVGAKVPCKKVVTQKIRHLHPERPRAKKAKVVQKNGKKKMIWIPDQGGWGDQIAQESKMCGFCAAKWGVK